MPVDALKIALIGGTGLGDAVVAEAPEAATAHDVRTPFGPPSGRVIETTWGGRPVLVLARHGAGHLLHPGRVNSRANVFALKALGATHVLASGAVGSLRQDIEPRHLAVPDQFIDKTHGRDKTFYDAAAVHVEFSEPLCPVMRRVLLDAGGEAGTTVHDGGCYVCMEGPAFGTRAESLMHRLWGGDLIGMTALPEARLAREAELPYALLALVTDYDAWREPGPPRDRRALLAEITGNLEAATAAGMRLLRRAVELAGDREAELMAAPARSALELAIWSDKARVPRAEVERLAPLWGRHFERDRRTSDAG